MAWLCTVLLAGCAASGPRVRPEAPTPSPRVWLLDVQEAPVALLEVPRLVQGDGVVVRAQGPQLQVSLRFAHGARVTPLASSVKGATPVLLASRDVHGVAGAPSRLTRALHEAGYEEALRALASLAEGEQDGAAREGVEALTEDALVRMARSREGNRVLVSLFDAMTSGHVTVEQASRLLAAEAQRRYPTPEEFVQALARVRVFPTRRWGPSLTCSTWQESPMSSTTS